MPSLMAAKPPSGHIRKRQYQPSITSYLNRDATAAQVGRPDSPWSPPLPAETQASLLSVGMRVRKSVPEGYKTRNTVKAQGYAFPSSAPPVSTTSTASNRSSRERRTYKVAGIAELQPFCGLHKTGGWAAQEMPSSSAPAIMQAHGYSDNEEDVPELMWSQSTIAATQSSFAMPSVALSGSRKRGYEEEIEDDLDAFFNDYDFDNAIITSTPTNTLTLRPIARLKSSGRTVEEGTVRVVGGDGFDFDDAAFLVPDEGMDTD